MQLRPEPPAADPAPLLAFGLLVAASAGLAGLLCYFGAWLPAAAAASYPPAAAAATTTTSSRRRPASGKQPPRSLKLQALMLMAGRRVWSCDAELTAHRPNALERQERTAAPQGKTGFLASATAPFRRSAGRKVTRPRLDDDGTWSMVRSFDSDHTHCGGTARKGGLLVRTQRLPSEQPHRGAAAAAADAPPPPPPPPSG